MLGKSIKWTYNIYYINHDCDMYYKYYICSNGCKCVFENMNENRLS